LNSSQKTTQPKRKKKKKKYKISKKDIFFIQSEMIHHPATNLMGDYFLSFLSFCRRLSVRLKITNIYELRLFKQQLSIFVSLPLQMVVVECMRCKRWASSDSASTMCNSFEYCYYLQAQNSGHLRILSHRYLSLHSVEASFQLRELLRF